MLIYFGSSYFSGPIDIYLVFDILISVFSFLGMFAYAYRKRYFSPKFWKVYLFLIILWEFVYNVLILSDEFEILIADLAIFYVFAIPNYIALYLYAFKFLEEKGR